MSPVWSSRRLKNKILQMGWQLGQGVGEGRQGPMGKGKLTRQLPFAVQKEAQRNILSWCCQRPMKWILNVQHQTSLYHRHFFNTSFHSDYKWFLVKQLSLIANVKIMNVFNNCRFTQIPRRTLRNLCPSMGKFQWSLSIVC